MRANTSLERIVVRLAISAGLSIVLAAAVFGGFRDVVLRFVPDDAFYYFEIARRIGNGEGSTFDGFNPTNGYHPLWLLLLVPLSELTELSREWAVRVVMLFDIGLLGVALWSIKRVAAVLTPRQAHVAPLVAGAFLVFGSHYGVESALAMALLGTLLSSVSKEDILTTTSRACCIGLLCGLLVMARLDAVVYVIAFDVLWFIDLVHRRRAQELVRWLLCLAIQISISALYIGFNLHNYGHALPISALIKTGRAETFSLAWAHGLMPIVGLLSAALGFLSLLLHRTGKGLLSLRIASLGTLILMALILVKGGQETYHWYYSLPALCSGLFVTRLISGFRTCGRIFTSTNWSLIGVSLLLFLTSGLRRVSQPSDFVSWYDRAIWIRENAPSTAVFAEPDCGILGYISQRSFINTDGLTNSFSFQEAIKDNTLEEWFSRSGFNAMVLPFEHMPSMSTDGNRRVLVPMREGIGGQLRQVYGVIVPWKAGSGAVADDYRLWRVLRVEAYEMTDQVAAPPGRVSLGAGPEVLLRESSIWRSGLARPRDRRDGFANRALRRRVLGSAV